MFPEVNQGGGNIMMWEALARKSKLVRTDVKIDGATAYAGQIHGANIQLGLQWLQTFADICVGLSYGIPIQCVKGFVCNVTKFGRDEEVSILLQSTRSLGMPITNKTLSH